MRAVAGCLGFGRVMMKSAAAAALLLAGPAAAAAQQPDAPAGEGKACFQPRPLPVCRSFWVTEFGVQWFVSEPPGVNNQRRWLATWEVGWMRNRTPDDAVGASVFLATNDHTMRSGVRARYRRWMDGETAVDLSPALILFQANENLEGAAKPGAAFQAGVTFHDWIGVTSQVEAAEGGVRLLVGVRLGGYPGAAVGAALPLYAFWEEGLHDDS